MNVSFSSFMIALLLIEVGAYYLQPMALARLAVLRLPQHRVKLDAHTLRLIQRTQEARTYRERPSESIQLAALGPDEKISTDDAVLVFSPKRGRAVVRLKQRMFAFNSMLGIARIDVRIEGSDLVLVPRYTMFPLTMLVLVFASAAAMIWADPSHSFEGLRWIQVPFFAVMVGVVHVMTRWRIAPVAREACLWLEERVKSLKAV